MSGMVYFVRGLSFTGFFRSLKSFFICDLHTIHIDVSYHDQRLQIGPVPVFIKLSMTSLLKFFSTVSAPIGSLSEYRE